MYFTEQQNLVSKKKKNFNSNLKLFLLTFGVNEVLMIMINKNDHERGFS